MAIGTDRAVAPLTVGGDIYCSGVVHRPSDRRMKEQIHEVVHLSILFSFFSSFHFIKGYHEQSGYIWYLALV